MSVKLGIFKQEQQVIQAIQELETAGFATGDIRIMAKDWEHSRRIEHETDVHVDEMRELRDTRQHMDDNYLTGVLPAGFMIGGAGFTNGGGATGIGAAGVWAMEGGANGMAGWHGTTDRVGVADSEMESALQDLGLDRDMAQVCKQAIAEGATAVAVTTGEGASRSGSDGGPDLTPGGTAEAVFRRCGADRII